MINEKIILFFIGISFLGFMVGLIGKNTNNANKKTFKRVDLYNYLMAGSVIIMLTLAFIYKILFI